MMCGETRRKSCTHLYDLVPSSGNDDWVHWVWRESDAADPLGVSLLSDVYLALS
jgi:hypothetical protein